MPKRSACTVVAVMISGANGFITSRSDRVELRFGGIPGDMHFGITKRAGTRESVYPRGTEIFNRRQISIVSTEELHLIAERLGVPSVAPEWLGANLCFEGYPALSKLPKGSRVLFADGSGLVCEGENLPCIHPGEVIQSHYPDVPKVAERFSRSALRLRGVVCVVERPGQVEAGSEAHILPG